MTVKYSERRFIINGKDQFLFGGEFHYFRIPREEWKRRLSYLKEAGCNLVSTYVPWVWHEINEGQFDFTGQVTPERDLKTFLELVKETGLYCIVRPGPYVMAEIRYHGVPEWLLKTYPEVIAIKRNGETHPTDIVSYRHPVFLDKVEKWYNEVNKIIAPMQIENNGPIILYQLCNEIGMFHWVTNLKDYNSDTIQHFLQFLQEKYETIDRFNKTYKLHEPSFEAFVETFVSGLPKEYPSFHFEWGDFCRKYYKDYANDLRRLARATGITVPFIINVHGFGDFNIRSRGTTYPIGLSQLYKVAEFEDVVMAGDFYPGHVGYDNYHDLALSATYSRAISNQDQPIFSAEFQSGSSSDRRRLYPQDLDLTTRTSVAHGMNALNYYMFFAGVNFEDIGILGRRHEWQAPVDSKGEVRPYYYKAQHLGRVFQTIGSHLVTANKKVHTYVGFNPDDYMTDNIEDRDRELLSEMVNLRDNVAFNGILRLLLVANIQFEAINLLKEFSPKEVPSLWVFATERMDASLQQKLVNYVKNGGKLIIYPQIPTKDLLGNTCRIFAEQLNLGEWEIVKSEDYLDVLTVDSVYTRQRLHFTQFDGIPIASYTRTGKNEVAAYKKSFGAGEVLVLGLAMGHDFDYQPHVVKEIASTMGIKGHLNSTNPNISLVERTNGYESFFFVSNFDEVDQTGIIYEDDIPLFDGEEVHLPPRSGAIFIRNMELSNGLIIDFATVELTQLENTDDLVFLTVKPIGAKGTLKINANGFWKTEHGTLNGNTILVKDITAEKTIKFKRIKQE